MNTATGNTNVYNNMSSNMSSNMNKYETSIHTYRSDTQMDKNNKLHESVQPYSNNDLYINTRNLYNNNNATILAKKE
jgi:hypothetical protein